jgi:hypothetical protein
MHPAFQKLNDDWQQEQEQEQEYSPDFCTLCQWHTGSCDIQSMEIYIPCFTIQLQHHSSRQIQQNMTPSSAKALPNKKWHHLGRMTVAFDGVVASTRTKKRAMNNTI